jgi:rubrerythrin
LTPGNAIRFHFAQPLLPLAEREPEADPEETEMQTHDEQWQCAHCGYTADGRFEGDICPQCGLTYWKCSRCGFLLTASVPPDNCPSCEARDSFKNVTCYVPECGGPQNIDPRL